MYLSNPSTSIGCNSLFWQSLTGLIQTGYNAKDKETHLPYYLPAAQALCRI